LILTSVSIKIHADGQTKLPHYAFILCTLCKESSFWPVYNFLSLVTDVDARCYISSILTLNLIFDRTTLVYNEQNFT